MNKLVSIIVPCWNGQSFLKEFIDCIIKQSYRPIEFCFVDDGSTDNTKKIFDDYLLLMIETGIKAKYIYQYHQGQAAALNSGLKIAKGKYITWADADDLLDKDNISAKVDFLEQNPNIGIVRNNANCLKDGVLSSGIAAEQDKTTRNLFEDLLLEKTFLYAGCFMIRRSLLEECYPDLIIPESQEGQNLQLVLPPTSRSNCGYIDTILMTYRIHPDSHSRHSRNIREQYNRIEGFKNLLMEIKPFCKVKSDYYDNLVEMKISQLKKNMIYSLAKRN